MPLESRRIAAVLAHIALGSALVGALVACDQDPFHLSQHELSGDYALERFETDWYYVVDSAKALESGGTFGGAVLRIGMRDSLIAAQIVKHGGGDTVFAMVNTRTRHVYLPLTASALVALSGERIISLERADSAWKSR
jgi:hypothetical protein